MVCEYFLPAAKRCQGPTGRLVAAASAEGCEACGRAAQSKLVALAPQEERLRLWGDWLHTGVHGCACACAHAYVSVHTHVFAGLYFGAESLSGMEKSSLLLSAGALSTSVFLFLSSQLPSSDHCCRAADLGGLS